MQIEDIFEDFNIYKIHLNLKSEYQKAVFLKKKKTWILTAAIRICSVVSWQAFGRTFNSSDVQI